MFYGEKLKQLRELYGFSRKDLANKLDVSEQSIGQYENDQIAPRLDVMSKLSNIFNVGFEFFTHPVFVKEDVIAEGAIAYRTKDRNSRKKINDELEYVSYAKYFTDYFDSFVSSNIGGFEILKSKIDNLVAQKHETQIGEVANTVRNFYHLKNNRDLMSKLEQSGITILEKDLGSTVDAYSGFTKDHQPYIILGNVKKTAVRRNFDLAHELGHLLLHSYVVMSELTNKEHTMIENEANEFASAFLMPTSEFVRDFKQISHNTNPDFYIDLKKKYMVSIGAMEYRAYKLKLISYQQNRYFWSQMTRKGYRTFEPLDDQIVPIKPGKINKLLRFLLDNNLFTIEDLKERFGIMPNFLIYLFDLKPDFFNKYLDGKTTSKKISSNVIDLNSIRQRMN